MNSYGFGIESFYFVFLLFYTLYLAFANHALKQHQITKKEFIVIAFIPLFILGGFRGETVGGDLINYLPEFKSLAHIRDFKNLFDEAIHEPGYLVYIKILSFLSDDSRMFLLGTSLLSLIGPFYIIYKYSRQPMLSVLIYYISGFYTNTFNNVRQSLAISIVLIAFCFLERKNLRKYIMLVLLASTFHYSAIAALLVYPIMRKELNLKRLFIISSSGLVLMGSLGYYIFSKLTFLFLAKYDAETVRMDSEGQGYGMFILYTILFIFTSYVYLRKVKRNVNTNYAMYTLVLTFIMLSMIIQLSAPFFHSMVRMTYYFFIPYMIIGLPYMISETRGIYKIAVRFLLIFLLVFFFRNAYTESSDSDIYKSNSQATIPYVFLDKVIF